MCGIVAAVAQRDVVPLLIAGLKALEYRGYDSAGISVLEDGQLARVRAAGKVRELESLYASAPVAGTTATQHTTPTSNATTGARDGRFMPPPSHPFVMAW